MPKSKLDYWFPKLARNRRRDRANRKALRKMGFAVWSFWEHELKGSSLAQTHRILARKLKARLNPQIGAEFSDADYLKPKTGCGA